MSPAQPVQFRISDFGFALDHPQVVWLWKGPGYLTCRRLGGIIWERYVWDWNLDRGCSQCYVLCCDDI